MNAYHVEILIYLIINALMNVHQGIIKIILSTNVLNAIKLAENALLHPILIALVALDRSTFIKINVYLHVHSSTLKKMIQILVTLAMMVVKNVREVILINAKNAC